MLFELSVEKILVGVSARVGAVLNADIRAFEKLAGVLNTDADEILYGRNSIVLFENGAISGHAEIFQIRQHFQIDGLLKAGMEIIQGSVQGMLLGFGIGVSDPLGKVQKNAPKLQCAFLLKIFVLFGDRRKELIKIADDPLAFPDVF